MFMLEKALAGGRRYWSWIGVLLGLVLVGGLFYLRQLGVGLGITGLSRDVTWGLYIAQFTFLVGVAASAVVVVLPYYLHDYKAFGKITVLGELLAVSAVTMCLLFIFVDLGQPMRVLNVLLYPSPDSVMFWDMVSLTGYLVLNVVISIVTLGAERKEVAPPAWIKPVIILSIPWAVSIHTVTAFLYSGLAGRPLWLTALLAPRFLASAFASGPALLILLTVAMRRLGRFDPGPHAIEKLSLIVAYAMTANVFFMLVEAFTVLYSQVPAHVEYYAFLFVGLEGQAPLVPWMWASVLLAAASLVLLLVPRYRRSEKRLTVACVAIFLSVWFEKGIGLIVGGFVPSPLGAVTRYVPTLPEASITLAIWAVGFLMITIFYKITLAVRKEVAAP